MRSNRWCFMAAVAAAALLATAAYAQESIPWRIDPGTPIAPEMAGGGEAWTVVNIPGLPAGATLGEIKVGPDGTVYVWATHRLLVPAGSLVKDVFGTESDPIGWRMPPGDPPNPDVGDDPTQRWITVTALYRFNGETWQPILQRGGETGVAIYLAPNGQLLASTNTVMGGVRIYRLAGSRWSIDALPWGLSGPGGDLVGVRPMGGVAAMESEPIGWKIPGGDPPNPDVGDDYPVYTRIGTSVLKNTGGRWAVVYDDPTLDTGGGELIVLGDQNVLVPFDAGQKHWDGATWHSHAATCTNHFHCGWGARDAEGVFQMYSTGCDETHRHACVWKFTENASRDLTGTMVLAFAPTASDEPPSFGSKVCGITVDNVYIAGRHGAHGFVYHFDGNVWQDLAIMADMPPAVSVGGNTAGEVWVALADGRLLRRPADVRTLFDKRVMFVPDPPIEVVLPASAGLQVRSEGATAEATFGLPEETDVTVAFFDLAGRRVRTVEQGCLPAGTYRRSWNLAEVPSGVYFCRLDAGTWQVTRKVAIHR